MIKENTNMARKFNVWENTKSILDDDNERINMITLYADSHRKAQRKYLDTYPDCDFECVESAKV